MVRLNDGDFCVHTWMPLDGDVGGSDGSAAVTNIAGLVVIFHGFLAHGLYPTVRYAAELLSSRHYAVVAADLRGHGRSPGLRGYLPGRDALIDDGVAITRYAQSTVPDQKCFLLGSSMGGAIALSVAHKMMTTTNESDKNGSSLLAGVVMLAPLLQLSISGPVHSLLWALSHVIPTWPILPSSASDAEKQYRDPVKRKECVDDEFAGKGGGKMRVASALTCVELAGCIQADFSNVTIPFLVLVADEDYLVNNQGAEDLYEKSPSTDKTIKHYPALHGILCEPSPLVDAIQSDLLEWIRTRS